MKQRLKGAELLLSIQARSYEEKKELDKLFTGFDGVKINTIKIPNSEIEVERQPADITQYDISMSDTESLTRIKQAVEAEMFSRFGIYDGTSKTHMTDSNNRNLSMSDSIVLDFELQARQDFADKVNTMFGTNITVDINEQLKEQQDGNIQTNPTNVTTTVPQQD